GPPVGAAPRTPVGTDDVHRHRPAARVAADDACRRRARAASVTTPVVMVTTPVVADHAGVVTDGTRNGGSAVPGTPAP
ncbi:hypothetical protein ABZW03_40120, partial [Kitasatospora sp. NPDC004799]|uniref:hypothetical protein n=1 Tax=Kitasatospora sp. NPDC004799 TaxID=3154460 RepID=UPI0033BCD394